MDLQRICCNWFWQIGQQTVIVVSETTSPRLLSPASLLWFYERQFVKIMALRQVYAFFGCEIGWITWFNPSSINHWDSFAHTWFWVFWWLYSCQTMYWGYWSLCNLNWEPEMPVRGRKGNAALTPHCRGNSIATAVSVPRQCASTRGSARQSRHFHPAQIEGHQSSV
jgi:hypothetical protein